MSAASVPTPLPLVDFVRQAREGADFVLPFSLVLPDAETPLEIRAFLRVLPGRRYSALADMRAESRRLPVFCKFFLGAEAQKRWRREERGAKLLAAQNLPTPRLLLSGFAEGKTPSENVGWLFFEELVAAVPLSLRLNEILALPEPEATTAARALFRRLVPALARLHARGLWHGDLHLDNALEKDGELYWIDGDGVRAEIPGQPLSARRARENTAMLCALFPLRVFLPNDTLVRCLDYYRRVNPVSTARWSLPALSRALSRQRWVRMRHWLRKIGRECGAFIRQTRGWRGLFGVRILCRAEEKTLRPLLDNPDEFIARGHLYKDGGASTVARVEYKGRVLLVKRYNIKNWRHALSRAWRPSRAWASWRAGHRLMMLGITTARPLAVIEERFWGLRGRAWMIAEHLDGEDALTRFARLADNVVMTSEELAGLKTLLAELSAARLGHGDLKGQNLIWQETARRWALIDLDSLRAHPCSWLAARAARRDAARFLRDFPKDSPLRKALAAQYFPRENL
ncbi:MAG: hypothetical protein LBG69_04820 [Zoogloeaceae bacterium]|nr:hypothetical protein [Zoogloeaceae bacterium]